MNRLPDGFILQMKEMLGERADSFLFAMKQSPEVSVKINRRKYPADKIPSGLPTEDAVSWCESGRYLSSRPLFTLNPLLHAGAFYVQDASSMIYETVIRKIIPMAMDTGHPVAILDLCAAPGGKTTSIINGMPDSTFIVANEVVPSRAKILRENLIKWGYPDFIITSNKSEDLARVGFAFDIISVDAPCSGEGMMRKEETAVNQWSQNLISSCASLQKEILENALKMLKPGGFLIYSTCTFNQIENEDQIEWLVKEKGLVPLDLGLTEDFKIPGGIDTQYPCYRFMPHLTRGEGLFLSVLRKETDIEEKQVSIPLLKNRLREYANIICDGIPQTVIKGKLNLPAPEAPLSIDFNAGDYPVLELTEKEAISYLRHEAMTLPSDMQKGYIVVSYENLPLGFLKNIGNRANNLYPPEWKIRMNIK